MITLNRSPNARPLMRSATRCKEHSSDEPPRSPTKP